MHRRDFITDLKISQAYSQKKLNESINIFF
jgi:hypothetical protein